MPYQFEVKEVDVQHTMTIRVTVKRSELGDTFGIILPEVWAHLQKLGTTPVGPPFALYHSFSADSVDVEGGMPVATATEGAGRVKSSQLPAGHVAATWHVGPYDSLAEAYTALDAWVEEQGREAAGAPWEIYWTDPKEVPDPARWRTEVFQPIN